MVVDGTRRPGVPLFDGVRDQNDGAMADPIPYAGIGWRRENHG
jgi:hypothetical protein